VFDTDQAADMAKAGADVLVPHMGLTSSGTIGAQTTITLQDAALRVQGMHDAAKKVNPDSGAVDTCFSTATCIRRYRIKCPHADRYTDKERTPIASMTGYCGDGGWPALAARLQ
jgi:predicted TIM-barrel enzyme